MIINLDELSINNKNKLDLYLYIKKEYKLYDLILGGSLSLIIQNIIEKREVNDLDVCYFKFFALNFTKTFKADSVISYTLDDNVYWVKNNFIDQKIDLFIDPKARYFKYRTSYKGETVYLNLQMPSEIMEAKLTYLHRGVWKHLSDLQDYFKYLSLKNEKFEINKKDIIEDKMLKDIGDSYMEDEIVDDNGYTDCVINDEDNVNKFIPSGR